MFIRVILFILTLGFAAAPLAAQQDPPRLYINQTNMSSQFVTIDFDINYGGYIEMHLFDEDGKKIWIYGVVKDKMGKHSFKIPTKPLRTGERYSYHFRYKGEEYNGSFYAP
ncbi:MAG: hypothetical protein AB8F95_22660 [Bacteroidia bacterium]